MVNKKTYKKRERQERREKERERERERGRAWEGEREREGNDLAIQTKSMNSMPNIWPQIRVNGWT